MDLSFEFVSDKNIHDWMTLAAEQENCFINAVNRSLVLERAGFNTIVYHEKPNSRIPAAFMVTNGVKKRFYNRFTVLDCTYGGLFLSGRYESASWQIKRFVKQQIVDRHFKKRLGVDAITYMAAPGISIDCPEKRHMTMPLFHSSSQTNSILYTRLTEDFLLAMHKTSRYEIRRGIKAMESGTLVSDRTHPDLIRNLLVLEQDRARTQNVSPLGKAYFKDRLGSAYHFPMVFFDTGGQPQSAVIYSLKGRIATFHYNASTREGKKRLLNKALLYSAMLQSREKGAQYFVLGNGYADFDNMKDVTRFKKRMSTHEAACPVCFIPLSMKGLVMMTGKMIKQMRQR